MREALFSNSRNSTCVRLYHAAACAGGDRIKSHGLPPDEPAGLLMCDSWDLAKDHARRAGSASLPQDDAGDWRGLIVEVSIPVDRVRRDPDLSSPGNSWVSGGVSPGEIVGMTYFDMPELDDGEVIAALAGAFDTDSQDWRRAATREMEP